MSWGDNLSAAWQAASATAQQAAISTVSSAQAAAAAVQQAAAGAVVATGNATIAVGRAAASAAVSTGRAIAQGAAATGKAALNVATFGARATGELAATAAKGTAYLADRALERHPVAGPAYSAAKRRLSPTRPPRDFVCEPCPQSEKAKVQRLQEREHLIKQGRAARTSPAKNAAAERLARNNEAVELARLSADAYQQFGNPPSNSPPPGWKSFTDEELEESGIDKALLMNSKAVLYKTPSDWPGGQKTVLAFRGTEASEAEDVVTNIDQALGAETAQYKSAVELGRIIAVELGPDVQVTGHSLGGGKAQAAGARGGLKGTMFNSAGLHPSTAKDKLPAKDQFQQFRTPYDLLTGTQNSAAMQSVLATGVAAAGPTARDESTVNFLASQLGMPQLRPVAGKLGTAFPRGMYNLGKHGYVIPPAVGEIVEVPALDDTGQPMSPKDVGGQHSIITVIKGIERQKAEDIATLRQ